MASYIYQLAFYFSAIHSTRRLANSECDRADFHVHLRDGDMSVAVVPTIRKGGVNQVYVMP